MNLTIFLIIVDANVVRIPMQKCNEHAEDFNAQLECLLKGNGKL